MKPVLVLLFLAVGFAAHAQTLKELLYSGKLKNDSNTVIRKTDDLSTKIDTGDRRKPVQPKIDSVAASIAIAPIDSTKKEAAIAQSSVVTNEDTLAVATEVVAEVPVQAAAPVKTPAKIWKEYADSLVVSLQQEVLSNKKIKKDTYYVTVDYELGTNGVVDVTNVVSSPANEILTNNIKQRLIDSPPNLGPVPKKVKRKYNFTVTKD